MNLNALESRDLALEITTLSFGGEFGASRCN